MISSCRLILFCFSGAAMFLAGHVFASSPPDPMSDRPWPYSSENSVADVQARFNVARTNENNQLPMLSLPSQLEWDAMDSNEKAIWLVNEERVARGLVPLHGIESNVIGVAQYYADYLLEHDVFNHDADGNSPWERLDGNGVIGACHDFLSVSENLAVLWGGWTLPLERAVYMWMYADSGSQWGHRRAILWYPYNNNSGPQSTEGFLGIGVAHGKHQSWDSSDIIVMNVFDPCAVWEYTTVAKKGDVNGDSDVTLADCIVTLQLLAGQDVVAKDEGDVNEDGEVGLAEAIWVLQKEAGHL